MHPGLTTWLTALLALCWLGCAKPADDSYTATPKPAGIKPGEYRITHHPQRLAATGPDACVQCHEDAVNDWKRSHHAHANRLVSVDLDAKAFTPTRRIQESGVTYEMALEGERFVMRVIAADGTHTEHELIGAIGSTPLRQYLAKAPGGKFQTISATYDVAADRWLDVYEGEDRFPGEWGHWQGQGMNWNANCAYCHTTEFKKNFDFESDSYHTTWTQHNIACAECHSGLEAHVKAAQAGTYHEGLPQLNTVQTIENCATCHARRDQLTADAFEVGDAFDDHFALALPDQPGLYFPDGKIRDEVYVYGSFKLSSMAHAGVSCMDCHNPHTMETILPTDNNLLCMRCHESGLDGAPVIQPTQHSFHPAGSTGNRCVECHMPKRTYMQVDPRSDHGFHSPDPLLTKELGIPNACSDCHTDQDLDWAIDWSERWYGDKLAQHPQRTRARVIAAAYAYQPEAMQGLLDLAKDERIPAWQATYIGLLGNYIPHEAVKAHCQSMLSSDDPMVRGRATEVLGRFPDGSQQVLDSLKDDMRSVRLAAARSLASSNRPIPDASVAKEFTDYLRFNADRPQSLLMLALQAARDHDTGAVETYVARAIALDRANGNAYQQGAILLSTAGLNGAAERTLKDGWAIAPQDPQFPYSLGLLAAEMGDLERAAAYLEEAVAQAPDFYRAWYNLSLAYSQLNRPQDAARAQRKAQGQ
jgi:predicted CXXCH cytochrome family protein